MLLGQDCALATTRGGSSHTCPQRCQLPLAGPWWRSPWLRGFEGRLSHLAQPWSGDTGSEALRRSGTHQAGQDPVAFTSKRDAAWPLIESSRAVSGRQNTAVIQSTRLSRHSHPRAREGGLAP